ncbi:MAG: DUF4160 domain-containing protein [Lachnospiraceae bacterium]|nr:DUF4160 domain-containing protein [Lachnospiraceae bacterium]
MLDFLGYKFFFWSNEDEEPPHVYVCKGKQSPNATKFWITGDGIRLEHNKSQIPQNDLKKIARYILENKKHSIRVQQQGWVIMDCKEV